jgi:RNA polymerase sigma-70 factor (ECF subfamily)
MKQSRIEKILLSLSSGQVEIGWTMFLDAYSGLLRSIVRQFETDDLAADDCYEFICAKLSDQDFRRLKAFDPSGPARFSTWLTTIAANLCKDWRRSEYGRQRPPKCVQALPELEQLVFQLLFRQGMTHHECLHVLKTRFPKLDPDDIARINGELYQALSANQRWQMSISRDAPVPADDLDIVHESPTRKPDYELQCDQDLQRLESALAKLEPEQSLLLRLRYQQDLTLKEVARLTGISDPYKARRAIDKALTALKKFVNS